MTNAEIISDALQRMANPPRELLTIKDCLRILRARTAYYLTREQQGDQKHVENFKEFYPASRDFALSDISNPDWVERRIWTGDYYADYEYVPTVNLDSLEEWRTEGRPAVSFYRDDNGLRMRLAYDWYGQQEQYRVWYAGDLNTVSGIDAGNDLPPNFAFMLSADIRKRGIAIILNKAAEFDKPVSPQQLAGWQAIQAEAEEELAEWQQAFNEYRNRSTGGRRGRQRRNVLRNNFDYGRYY